MASTATTSLKLEKPGAGDYRGVWAPVINQIVDMVDDAIAGVTTVATTGGTTTLTDTDYAANEARRSAIKVTGALTSNVIIVVPTRAKSYRVYNATTNAFTVSIKTSAGSAIAVPQGFMAIVHVQSTNEVLFAAPPVNITTGKISDTSLATASALTAEINRATAAENTLIGPSGSISGIHDVDTTTTPPSTNDTLVWNGTKWVPGTAFNYFATGMEMDFHGTTAPAGWVLASGRTIGNASSGATERANADTSALFSALWSAYSNTVCPVSGGRSGSAAADFAANKTITLPDKRGRVSVGRDNMGGSTAGRVTSAGSGIVGTTMGATGGDENVTLARANLPNVALTVTGTTSTDGSHEHNLLVPTNFNESSSGGIGAGAANLDTNVTVTDGARPSGSHNHSVSGNTNSINGGVSQTSVNKMPPTWINTKIIKL